MCEKWSKILNKEGFGEPRFPEKVQPRFELRLQESKPCVITNYTIRPKLNL